MKKFLIVLALLVVLFVADIGARKTHHKKHKKKQHDSRFLASNQKNLNVQADSNHRVKLAFIKGTIEKFLAGVGFNVKDILEMLRVPIINYNRCMHYLKDLVRKKSPANQASSIKQYLNANEIKDFDDKFKDEKKVEAAIQSVEEFFHPTRVLGKKEKSKTAPEKKEGVEPKIPQGTDNVPAVAPAVEKKRRSRRRSLRRRI